MPNQNWVWGVYIYHKYWDNTRFRQKKLHAYDFQVRLWVAAFLAFLVLKFWKCGKIWPSISKWTYKCQKNLKIQVRKYSAFDLAFLTFVGLFKILLRSLRCKKSGGMQESCTLAFYHQKQFSLKISHFGPVWKGGRATRIPRLMNCNINPKSADHSFHFGNHFDETKRCLWRFRDNVKIVARKSKQTDSSVQETHQFLQNGKIITGQLKFLEALRKFNSIRILVAEHSSERVNFD